MRIWRICYSCKKNIYIKIKKFK
uniref:Uncharacterized protein n=1 Tax=Anguilla anguilla TaxID=7936 RepID=A0A0E9RX49_ANGAN